MLLTVLHYPDPRLREKSAPVGEITDDLRALAKDMAETMYDTDGIGLAAPQVGRLIRFITIDVSGPDKREDLMFLVNPRFTPDPEAGYEVSEEGCLSVEDYRAKVRRYAAGRLDALDLEGKPFSREVDGLLAVCVQHEIDHLDGKLFIDHLSRLKRSLYEARVKKMCRKNREEK